MHRPIRHFAEAFARAGIPTLRFDYDGTGDSAGDDRDPGRVRAWLDSIHDAIEHVKHESGADGVVLVGIRLGATLASAAAAERSDVRGVVAIAPVDPKTYLRELDLLQATMQLTQRGSRAEGDRETSGFLITRETATDLKRLPKLSADLVFDRDDAEFLAMNDEPHKAAIPHQMIASTTDFIRNAPHDAGTPPREMLPTTYEELVFVDGVQFGILTKPSSRPRRAILLLNAGAQHHIGPNRLWVRLARKWAEQGHLVLRLDLSGLGDSVARSGRRENEIYSDIGAADVRDAVRYLRTQAERVTVIGLCGSAYQAFKAAVQGMDAQHVVLLNLRCFFWKDGSSLDAVSARTATVAEAQRYKSVMFESSRWKKLLTGKVNVRAASRIVGGRLVAMAVSRGRRLAQRVGLAIGDDLAAELSAVARHGTRLRFVFSDHEPGEALLPELAGRVGRRQSIERVEGADHTFTAMWTHSVLEALLTRYIRDEIP